MDESIIKKAVENTPGSPLWELELCRREYNEAGNRHKKARDELDDVTRVLVDAAVRLGEAQEAAKQFKDRTVGRIVL